GNNLIEAAEVLQENHYYPFGMEMQGGWLAEPGVEQRYGYNGKELNEEVGWHDYGARWYDAAVGRWANIDPLSEMMYSWSPYNYVYNNPISYIDPLGLSPYKYNWETQQYENSKGKKVNWETVYGSTRQTSTLDVFIYNDQNANTRLTTKNLVSFVNEVSSIMNKNGISENVNYTLLKDLTYVSSFASHRDKVLFLALTNRMFGTKEGATKLTPTGNIGFYSILETGREIFHTGVDVDKFRVGQGGATDPNFRGWWGSEIKNLAYAGAHELFHQLDIHSRMAIPGNMSSYPFNDGGHYNGNINILNSGGAPGTDDSRLMLPEGVRRRILEYLNYR
ncbi:RHS repeat-associated core domain-containing protein, partial [Lewinella lacunae]